MRHLTSFTALFSSAVKLVIAASLLSFGSIAYAGVATWNAFDGTTIVEDTYTYPTAGAADWAGFSNSNADLYPLCFGEGGSVSLTAAVPSGGDANLRFRFEYNPWPEVDPNIDNLMVAVSGSAEQSYSVSIPAQASEQTFSSLVMYIVERDVDVVIKDVTISSSACPADTVSISVSGSDLSSVGLINYTADATGSTVVTATDNGDGTFTADVEVPNGTTSIEYLWINTLTFVPEDLTSDNSAGLCESDEVNANSYRIFDIATADGEPDTFGACDAIDTDNDGIVDVNDPDDDNDGINDENDVAPLDPEFSDKGAAMFSEAFGNTVIDTGPVYTFPTEADSWGGFANLNTDLYPIYLSEAGTLTFDASVPSGGDAEVYFRLEKNPHPDVEPSYDTESITVSGSDTLSYSVTLPSQGGNSFRSFLMYVTTPDVAVAVSNVVVNADANSGGGVAPATGGTITFQVDMTGVDLGGNVPTVNGTFNNWCGACASMTDEDGDNVWTIDIELESGSYEYKYALGAWVDQETVPGECALDGTAEYVNRFVSVDGSKILAVTPWSGCPTGEDTPVDGGGDTGGLPGSGELVTDGAFDGGSATWYGNAYNPVDGVNQANIEAAGNPWDVNLSGYVDVAAGQDYTLSFDVSGGDRTIIAGIGQSTDPYWGHTATVTLNATTQTIVMHLNASLDGLGESTFGGDTSRVIFDMGADVGAVSIDNVSLTAGHTGTANLGGGDTGGGDTGGGDTGGGDTGGVAGNLVDDGSFEGGSANWYGNAYNPVDGVNQANIEAAGNPWDVNLSGYVDVAAGQDYTLSFDVSGGDRTIIAGIGQSTDPYWGHTATVTLNATTQTIVMHLNASLDGLGESTFGGDTSRVIFDMGADVGAVSIDNVSLTAGHTGTVNLGSADAGGGDTGGGDTGGGDTGGDATGPQFTEAFGGTVIADGPTYSHPDTAENWGGFTNMNTSLYPISFTSPGSITFNASVPSGGDVNVRFRFEANPYPDVDPLYNTDPVLVSGAAVTSYTINVPAQGSNTYNSFLMYLGTMMGFGPNPDSSDAVVITDVVLNADAGNGGGSDPEPSTDSVVTFSVDMTGVDLQGQVPTVNGTFNNWCGNCAPMTDDDGDNVWTVDITLADGTYEYKYALGAWVDQETVPGACALDASAEYVNRAVTVAGADIALDTTPWSACPGGDGGPTEPEFTPADGFQFTEAFSGTTIDGSVYTFPGSADSWAGFANMNTSLYPMTVAEDSVITFTGSVPAGGDAVVRFRFEANPYPNTEPSFDTGTVTVSGADAATYSISVPSQGANTFNSFLLYLDTRDVGVSVTDVAIAAAPAGPADSDNDGVNDDEDAFPNDPSETVDTDNDGIGNNADTDDDGDGVADALDADPLDSSNTTVLDHQSVFVVGSPKGMVGSAVSVTVGYDVSNDNSALTGLGLNIHYDSSVLEFDGVSDLLTTDNISQGAPADDTDDLDGDASTDKYITANWASLFGNWPGTLPSDLLTATFNVADDDSLVSTVINFSATSNAAGYAFAPTNYSMDIISGSFDFDASGTADALTDGLLLLRYTFGLRGDSLTAGAIASASTMTSAEVEAAVADSAASVADIDGSGNVDALTDGLLLLRYLFGLRGDSLVSGAIAGSATRTTAADVEAYIVSMIP